MLYLGSAHAAGKGPLVALNQKGEPLADQDSARRGLRGIVVLDGNWAQAKALWWRNAWLTRLRRFVVVPDGPSLYGSLRKEPFRALIAKARSEGVRDVKRDRRKRR